MDQELQKKMTKIMVALTVVIALGGGIFIYKNEKANAQWEADRQAAIEQSDKQKKQEEEVSNSKAGIPTVGESHPARYIAEESAPVTTPVTQEQKTVPEQEKSTGSEPVTTTTTPNEESSKDPVASQELPKLTKTPPAAPVPKVIDEPVAAITELSEADIRRLQSYSFDSDGELYVSFQDMYTKQRGECDALLEKFSPITLSAYNKAKVDWLTSPKLVYYSPLAQYCVRGILSLTYYGDNPFGLTPNVTYQREVEYRLDSSVKNGANSLTLDSIHYLSGFKAVQ